MSAAVRRRFLAAVPAGVVRATLRVVEERSESLSVVRDVVQPPRLGEDRGAMVTVQVGQGIGYAATSDLSGAGLRKAMDAATAWATVSDRLGLGLAGKAPEAAQTGRWSPDHGAPWSDAPLAPRLDALKRVGARLRASDAVLHWSAELSEVQWTSHLIGTDGLDVHQQAVMVLPELTAVAEVGGITQRRTLGAGRGRSQQGGAAWVDSLDLGRHATRIGEEAVALCSAAPCPTERTTLVLSPDQMMLQIHESIGHPLELDRILGDERNYAGTSFVTMDMLGAYQYGSDLLNIRFDPTVAGELASYGWDDDGTAAAPALLIENGRLVRLLGGATSQERAGVPGVANSRACSWNRPPIDRMANLNLDPGDLSFEDMVGQVERGVYMQSNRSWSIDDRRDKFQFGCELAREIRNGELGGLLRDPNYRGRSASFWRALSGVGNAATREVLGTPFCGKGEPNQVIRVGHASPVCRFDDIAVFGGEA